MSAQHTPGPWGVGRIFNNYGEPEIVIERVVEKGVLAIAVALPGLQGQIANARLIAASPDLLEALQGFIDGAEAMGWRTNKARAAIAKATGEQA